MSPESDQCTIWQKVVKSSSKFEINDFFNSEIRNSSEAFDMTWLRVLSVAVFPLSITGCYMSGSITNIDGSNPTAGILGKNPTMENVAGSSQYQVTPLTGYRVRHSAGLVMSKQMGVTPQGFRVYSNASGKITSQELNQ